MIAILVLTRLAINCKLLQVAVPASRFVSVPATQGSSFYKKKWGRKGAGSVTFFSKDTAPFTDLTASGNVGHFAGSFAIPPKTLRAGGRGASEGGWWGGWRMWAYYANPVNVPGVGLQAGGKVIHPDRKKRKPIPHSISLLFHDERQAFL
jgi:hypothetical protein